VSLRTLALPALLVLGACQENPETFAVHEPIYPAAGDDFTYRLEHVSGGPIQEVRLYERVDTFVFLPPLFSFVIPGVEIPLQTWTAPTPTTFTFDRIGGHPANSFVYYRFEVDGEGGENYRHEIQFAIRPYPFPNLPAPVYAVGDRDDIFDVVFIPDTDITDMDNFRDHCRRMIREAFLDEPTTRKFRRSFNFYVNPVTGHATDYDNIAVEGYHQLPANLADISFAEGKVLMHERNIRDYASGGTYSTEMWNRGTVMHESGHGLFGLADEYPGGAHWQAADLPNNWSSQATAAAEAPGRGKTASDVVQMGTTGWWKMCGASCQLNVSGLTHSTYDRPCQDRIIFTVLDNIIN
jgi:hypothetical protein